MRWWTQWDASPFPGLCASCSKQAEELCFSRKTRAMLHWWERHSYTAFSTAWTIYIGSRKSCTMNSHSRCNRGSQNVRRGWGFCVPITIVLSGSSWEGRCCFRKNLWFLSNLWAYISEQEIGSRHKLSLADLIYMQQKYHLQLSWDWPILNMPSLITCVACSSGLIARTLSPRSLAGEGYTEHVVP